MHYYHYYRAYNPACRSGGIIRFAIKVGITAYAINYLHKSFTHRQSLHPQIANAPQDTASFHQRLHQEWSRTFGQQQQHNVQNLPNGRFSLEIDLPGLRKEDLVLSVNEHEKVVVIKGKSVGDGSEGRRERNVEETRIELPKVSDVSDLKATFVDGVLRVNTGKQEFEGKRIQVD
ncbi:hypothetical protein BDR26DRAFT_928971 [Obelidium mucronatum]|nr:hypothetical protein BDR26DRAFT_928971 [Obelidium mucronatum]